METYPKLANRPGTVTALSGKKHFKGFTDYQIAIFEHDKDMQTVYEKYLSKEQIEAQKNLLKENFVLHSQLGLYFNITPLKLKIDHLSTNYNKGIIVQFQIKPKRVCVLVKSQRAY